MLAIDSSQVEEFGISDENDVIAVGFKCTGVSEFHYVIVSIERRRSPLRQDGWGPHIELDGRGYYHALIDLSLSPDADRLSVLLTPHLIAGDQVLSIELPELSAEQRRLIGELCTEIESAKASKLSS